MSLICRHSEICAACPWMPVDYAEQSQRKINALNQSLTALFKSPLPIIKLISVGESSLRNRADLVVFEQGFGLYQKMERKLFPVQECPQLSKELSAFYHEIKKQKIPLKTPSSKGSLRLRISPCGRKGIWLDFSNEDIQFLFEEKEALHRLLSLAYVEVGQKRKKLIWDQDRFRLKESEFHHWTRTWAGDKAISLFSVVGGFSQSSDHANQIIIQTMSQMLQKTLAKTWLEFGCGNGNLSFPLAFQAEKVIALEYEGLAVDGFEKTLDENPEFRKKIRLLRGDFQKAVPDIFAQNQAEGILVNPPRSGLKDFLNPLFDISISERPKDFVYMSCFLESFSKDSLNLLKLGYSLKELCIVDQFPQSEHFEILSRWQLLSEASE